MISDYLFGICKHFLNTLIEKMLKLPYNKA